MNFGLSYFGLIFFALAVIILGIGHIGIYWDHRKESYYAATGKNPELDYRRGISDR